MTVGGRLEMRGTGQVITTGSDGSSEVVGGDRAVHVAGMRTDATVGDTYETVGGAASVSVSKDSSSTVGGSRRSVTNTNDVSFVGGVEKRKVMGNVPPTGDCAAVFEYIQGGVEYVIGNPASGALPAQQSASWIGYAGPFNFVTQPVMGKGGFNVVSALPGSVNLGCDGMAIPKPDGSHEVVALPAPFPVMMHTQFMLMFEILLAWMDAHTHQAIIMSTPPIIPASALVKPLLPAIASQRVKVGF
jgi:hypothetical protein